MMVENKCKNSVKIIQRNKIQITPLMVKQSRDIMSCLFLIYYLCSEKDLYLSSKLEFHLESIFITILYLLLQKIKKPLWIFSLKCFASSTRVHMHSVTTCNVKAMPFQFIRDKCKMDHCVLLYRLTQRNIFLNK